jgi:hypothetical protein
MDVVIAGAAAAVLTQHPWLASGAAVGLVISSWSSECVASSDALAFRFVLHAAGTALAFMLALDLPLSIVPPLAIGAVAALLVLALRARASDRLS